MADRAVKVLLADGPCLGQWVQVFPTREHGMPQDLYVCPPGGLTEAGIHYRQYRRVGDGRSMRYRYHRDYTMWFQADGTVGSLR